MSSWYTRSWVPFCCAFLLATGASSVWAGESNDSAKSASLHRAEVLTEQAVALAKSKKFNVAADSYLEAIVAWKEHLTENADDANALKKLSQCKKNLTYCLDQPIRKAMKEAEARIKSGEVRAGTQDLLEAAEDYAVAQQKADVSMFRNNRVYCLDRAAMAPIRHADKLNEQGKLAEAVEFYQLGIKNYAYAHAQLGNHRFARNVTYATEHLATCQFAHRLATQAPAPDFNLESPRGDTIRLSNFRGKTVLLVFWAGWCGACRGTLPELEALYQDSAEKGLVVLGLNLDSVKSWDHGGRDAAQEMIDKELTFPVAWATGDTARDYGQPKSVPTLIWIDAQGRLVRQVPSSEVRIIQLLREFETLQASP